MQNNFRNGVVLVLLGVGALATWLFGHGKPAPEEGGAASRSYPLGYYVRDAVLLGTDNEGQIVYRVRAALAQAQPDSQRLELEKVRVEYQASEQIPWTISADSGEALAGTQGYIDLEGNVLLARNAEEGSPTTIRTERLRLDPNRYIASTDAAVRLSFGDLPLSGVGLEADLKNDSIKLESQVHAIITP